jgi:hypothetical protein
MSVMSLECDNPQTRGRHYILHLNIGGLLQRYTCRLVMLKYCQDETAMDDRRR